MENIINKQIAKYNAEIKRLNEEIAVYEEQINNGISNSKLEKKIKTECDFKKNERFYLNFEISILRNIVQMKKDGEPEEKYAGEFDKYFGKGFYNKIGKETKKIEEIDRKINDINAKIAVISASKTMKSSKQVSEINKLQIDIKYLKNKKERIILGQDLVMYRQDIDRYKNIKKKSDLEAKFRNEPIGSKKRSKFNNKLTKISGKTIKFKSCRRILLKRSIIEKLIPRSNDNYKVWEKFGSDKYKEESSHIL